MSKNHKGLIEEYHRKEGGERSNSTLNNYFLQHPKKVKMAKTSHQTHFTNLVARWTSCSLRPFLISEDKELQNMIDFATSINDKLELSLRRQESV